MEGVQWEEQEQGRLLRFRRQAEPGKRRLCDDDGVDGIQFFQLCHLSEIFWKDSCGRVWIAEEIFSHPVLTSSIFVLLY